jgi:hypothetical protein
LEPLARTAAIDPFQAVYQYNEDLVFHEDSARNKCFNEEIIDPDVIRLIDGGLIGVPSRRVQMAIMKTLAAYKLSPDRTTQRKASALVFNCTDMVSKMYTMRRHDYEVCCSLIRNQAYDVANKVLLRIETAE